MGVLDKIVLTEPSTSLLLLLILVGELMSSKTDGTNEDLLHHK